MLIDFKKAVAKHRIQIKGVIHVGAHFGQEYPIYKELGIDSIIFIEPCQKAFTVLKDLFTDTPGVSLLNYACGAIKGDAIMNVEQANQGMSNSLLAPAKHLEQYPSIQFTDKEQVRVITLDELLQMRDQILRDFDTPVIKANLLIMDVQGYELEVLKGAPETLQHIDYIYTEINRDEVYEGCAKVWEMDAFLKDFTRVETSWAGGAWGDAIYRRNTLPNGR